MSSASETKVELAGFLDTGLDLTTDSITEAERAQTLGWYREHHDHGDLDLARFARFQLRHDPATFKRPRRYLLALGREPEGESLPIAVAVLMYIHAYAVLGNGKGTLYEIVAARALGVTREHVVETLALAALQGGPLAVNAVAEFADDYLAEWPADEVDGVDWPEGWAPDVDSLRSGIDLDSDALEPGELDLIRAWYVRTEGDVPGHVELLAATAPTALKTQRARFETAVRGALPAQLVPLLAAHLSAIRLWPTPLRRSLRLARALGVRRGEAISTLLWAAVYGGEVVMETAVDPAGDVLEDWVYPVLLTHGKGCRVWDVDGNEYLDLRIGDWVMILGHANERVRDAVVAQLEKGTQFGSADWDLSHRMATLLVERMPSVKRIRFLVSGTEANLLAVRLARAFTGRTAVAKPVQGAAGMIAASTEYLERLREVTARLGIVLIFDEVVTFPVTYGGAQAYHGVTPDLTTSTRASRRSASARGAGSTSSGAPTTSRSIRRVSATCSGCTGRRSASSTTGPGCRSTGRRSSTSTSRS